MASKKRKPSPAEEMKTEQQEQKLWVDWRTCPARGVLLDDLAKGRLPLKNTELSADRAFLFYRSMPEFENVCFSQFRERLADHRLQITKEYMECKRGEDAFRGDQARGFKNTRTHNRRGELILHLTPIDELVREDVRAGKHKGLSSSELQATRPEYRKLDNTKFKEKLYQEVKTQKFLFGWDLKRLKKNGRMVPALYKQVT
jgi:hypothetical protein